MKTKLTYAIAALAALAAPLVAFANGGPSCCGGGCPFC